MENTIPYASWLEKQYPLLFDWLTENVLAWDTFAQLCAIAVTFWLAQILSRHAAAFVENQLKKRDFSWNGWIHASYREIFSLVFAVIFLWLAVAVAQAAKLPFHVMGTALSLTVAWGVIRFTSSIIKSPFWARLAAVTLWMLAALNIVGWLGPAITHMNKVAFSVGGFRFSLLLVIKSLLAFAALLWVVGLLAGLLERRFSKAEGLTPSQRVLFSKLSNIALYTAAGLIGLNIIGLDLTTFTVFSGALGLGIGFGLQKVFSNLISGIILLLDKSVKPGDVVAIGDTYGWVNSLGARYVSVLTRDGKEHLIPNEDLITQKVENWSHSDKKVRLHVPIGVAYKSDVHLVRKLLLQAAGEQPRILKTPAPLCLITGFGDSSIDYDLRIWVNDPENGVSNIKSAVYFRAWELFKENGVEIPFPQRDLHVKVDSAEALTTLLRREDKRA